MGTPGALPPRRPADATASVVELLGASEAGDPWPRRRAGSSPRSPSAPTWRRRRRSTRRSTRCSTSRRSSASTTSSARSRWTTSSPCASPTDCSSRSGTATTSPTSRSTCRRRSASRAAPRSSRQTGAFRDMVVTHLFQVLSFVAMEPPTSLAAKQLRDEKAKVYESLQPVDVAHVVRGQYDGYLSEPGVDPGTRRPRRSSPSGSRSTTGAGPGCRSSCAPASRSASDGR